MTVEAVTAGVEGVSRTAAHVLAYPTLPQSAGAPKHLVESGISPLPVISAIGVVLVGLGLFGLVVLVVVGRGRGRRPAGAAARAGAAALSIVRADLARRFRRRRSGSNSLDPSECRRSTRTFLPSPT